MKQSIIIIYGALAILLIVAYFMGGIELIFEGLNISLATGYNSALMLLASFVVIGQLNVLLTSEMIEGWLHRFKGIKAILVSAFAGGLFPGGPYIYYPFIATFAGKNLPFYILISFVLGKQIYDFSRLPMEASLISPQIALIRYIITLPIPIVVGLFARKFLNSKDIISYSMEVGDEDFTDHNNS